MRYRISAFVLLWILSWVGLRPVFADGPEIDQVVRTLEGKIVYCRTSRDEDTQGFRFDDWLAYVENSDSTSMVSISFIPRFMRCQKSQWEEDPVYRSMNHLVYGIYESGWLGIQRIQSMDQADFPSLGGTPPNLRLQFPLKGFLTDKEWRTLTQKKTLKKSAIFFPWPSGDPNSPRTGVPAELYMDASWYEVIITFGVEDDKSISVRQISNAYRDSRGKGQTNK